MAQPNAVAKLAATLLNITAPDVQPADGSKPPQAGLQHQPGRLLVKFKELYGGNYSAVAQLVNDWAGIDLIQVGSNVPSPCTSMGSVAQGLYIQESPFDSLHHSAALSSVS